MIKILLKNLGSIPMPLSFTANIHLSFSSLQVILILGASSFFEYLIALSIKLNIIFVKWTLSALITEFVASKFLVIEPLLWSINNCVLEMAWLIISWTSISLRFNLNSPLSRIEV